MNLRPGYIIKYPDNLVDFFIVSMSNSRVFYYSFESGECGSVAINDLNWEYVVISTILENENL